MARHINLQSDYKIYIPLESLIYPIPMEECHPALGPE